MLPQPPWEQKARMCSCCQSPPLVASAPLCCCWQRRSSACYVAGATSRRRTSWRASRHIRSPAWAAVDRARFRSQVSTRRRPKGCDRLMPKLQACIQVVPTVTNAMGCFFCLCLRCQGVARVEAVVPMKHIVADLRCRLLIRVDAGQCCSIEQQRRSMKPWCSAPQHASCS